jgi:hypothetical protein
MVAFNNRMPPFNLPESNADPAEASETVPSTEKSDPSSGASNPPTESEFDDEDRRRGLELQKHLTFTVATAIFVIGKLCSQSHEKLAQKKSGRGRNSLYGKWLDAYVPNFERKTLDRWRVAYELFAPLVAEQIGTACPDFLENFELSAIYLLCRPTVSAGDRMAAIGRALAGEKVLARSISTSAIQTAIQSYKTTIELPAGTVKIAINHSDFLQALREAIHEIEFEC